MGEEKSLESISKMIDHSLLHPTLTDEDLKAGCLLARRYDVAAVCIKPYAVKLAKEILSGTSVAVCTVVGFPHGSSTTDIKVEEARKACEDGATEIDFVVNIGKVLSRDWDYVSREIKMVNDTVVERGAIVKVIFENDYLTDEFKIKLCHICNQHRVAFVKTSTGYGFVKQPDGTYMYKGAVERDVILMRKECIPEIQIKVAGRIRTLDDLLKFKALGATRIGTTATEAILEEAKRRGYK
ncbi:MAG: deoxyribose-phosphate aldolase [Candidatus Brockarchaeota archaeon]|nr:deoxyribose-phosphate aldolase [Candidatus Brockarchaeota archaeon]